jgi:cell division transport system permease protein
VTLGGVVLVQKSAIAWSSDVGREVTIQIRPVEGEVMESEPAAPPSPSRRPPRASPARAP